MSETAESYTADPLPALVPVVTRPHGDGRTGEARGLEAANARAAAFILRQRRQIEALEAGLPDYVAVRPPRLVFLEIKGWRSGGRRPGQPTAEQSEWLEALNASGAEWRLAWPEDLSDLAQWLA
ncbi:MAG TPA: hypothetical protein VFW75_05980 [Acetobacteraceae bacterium]|nr:hypothetical protein [Acetobacteraceae bacterium]